ncbi:M20 metallopeptidase family protein [Fundicoccus culcitae]|uniref:Amidohydrolase n=1 Tax=Fundicoccus culcitae TaxID=2969821 RepID=A0ABY5P2F5_9LACT|nr:amidohydrolase [Fundicoccus culcitae]UUX32824.1 amidohydrolase [Fundicoccus culcitae]
MSLINIPELAASVQADMVKWRRDLHQIPELGLELPQTIAYVSEVLDTLGIAYDNHFVNGNAIVALIKGTKEAANQEIQNRVLGLRADMDGLPIKEQTGLPFASLNENMHACGHDGHTAMLLGAAKVLQANRDQFAGTVKLLLQPGEEYPGGAEPMIKEGAMKNPTVTRVLGIHEGYIDPKLPKGTIAYKSGPMMASMDRFLIEIKGKGYHGAYPENAQDPIAAAGQLITALQTIKSRNIKAVNPAVVSITRVQGGFNQNIIPDNVELEGTVRALNDETRAFIHSKIEQIAHGIGVAMDVECVVTYDYKYPPVVNDATVTTEIVQSLEELFPGQLVEVEEPLMGGEDFAFYLYEAPGTFLFLSNPADIEGKFHGHHHAKFDVDEAYFSMGAATFIKATLDYLN